jgi:hypothetical protein
MSTITRKLPVTASSMLHSVSINWTDTSVYDQRYNFNCKQVITVLLNKQEDNREFYVIIYEWIYNEDIPGSHPFCYDQIVPFSATSIVHLWRNKESDSLVKYLVMSDKDLVKYSGAVSASRFRRDLIIAIELFHTEGGKLFESGSIWEHQSRFRIYTGDGQDPPELGGHGWAMR